MDRKYNFIGDENSLSAAYGISRGYTEEALVKASNMGIYKRGLKDAESISDVRLVFAGSSVIVTLPEATVRMKENVTECRCSCASKTVCRHITAAAAILFSLEQETGKAGENAAPEENEQEETKAEIIPENEPEKAKETERIACDKSYLSEVISLVSGTLKKGIISCGETDAEAFSRLSLSAPAVHKEIGRLCRGASADIDLMLGKKAGFSAINAAQRLCRIYNTAIASTGANAEMLLFSGNEYESIGTGEFICFGLYPHRSLSGFAGVTAVLFERDSGIFYTYTAGMPDIYEKTEHMGTPEALARLTKARSHWQNDISLKMISGHYFTLYFCKADKRRQISSSKQTTCAVLSAITSNDVPTSAEILSPEEEYDYFSPEKKPRFAVIRADCVADIIFDGASQTLHYTIVNAMDELRCETLYTGLSKHAISFIRSLDGKMLANAYFLVRFMGKKAQAVSFIGKNGVNNIYMEE